MADLDKGAWTYGIGWNIVDDDGRPFRDIFNAKKSWNIPGYPSRISVEKFYRKGFSFTGILAINNYKTDKIINNHSYPGTQLFLSFDLNAKFDFNELYDFNKIFGKAGKKYFDIYITHGWGYTYRAISNIQHTATVNIGFGLNIWIYKGLGINLQSIAKFGLRSPFYSNPSNYLQHSFGIVYKFTPDPNSTKRKLRLRRKVPQPSYQG